MLKEASEATNKAQSAFQLARRKSDVVERFHERQRNDYNLAVLKEEQVILDELAKRYANGPYEDIWETSDFSCRELAPGVYLLTYVLLQNHNRRTRRTTIWQRTVSGWKAVFHQGTLVS